MVLVFADKQEFGGNKEMNFKSSRLPSSLKEVEWYWDRCVRENIDFSKVTINKSQIDFTKPADYFDLTDGGADKISFIGRQFDFFAHHVALKKFELNIFGNLNTDTQIGVLLNSVNHLRATASAYGMYATFTYIDKSVYCAFTICLVDKDTGTEMETAVVEIGQDEGSYIQPVFISKEALDYFSYDDIAKLSYWLGSFWVGIQYEMNNRPEEIRVIGQRGSISGDSEEYKKGDHIVLVRRIVPVDEDGNIIKCGATDSGRKYSVPAWGVRGHARTLPDGRVIYVCPYRKGKERNNQDTFVKKGYQFVDKKIGSDIN
ncbi:hypothetical protein SDC9_49290 [bioreactor metagenome]|uniref:Uncharacterized protein n=1 Tax=bioreactor metagenome TaxID=1076179 RepID=A0A644WHT4_9ZZZZ